METEIGTDDQFDDGEHQSHTADCFLIDQLYIRKLIGKDHHWHGVQMITMRKMFLNPVAIKIGTLMVKHDDGASPDKEIPMRDTDYLRVMRRIKDISHARLIREICSEDADPEAYYRFGSSNYLRSAFDALVEADEFHMEERMREEEKENACN